jgi:hypothetical protein
LPFKQGLDGSIPSISHPPANPQAIGSAFGLHSEKDTLHPAADDGMGSDFVFHGYFASPGNAERATSLPAQNLKTSAIAGASSSTGTI